MRNKKTYIVLIVILFIFFLIMFLIFGLDNIKNTGYDTTIIVGEDTIWTYNKKKWNNVSNYKNLNWEKYNIYLNNVKTGNYYLVNDSKWYAFDDKKNAVMLDGDLLAYKSNHNIDVSSFNTSEIDDYSYVNSVLESNSLSKDSEYTALYKVVIDFDNDGLDEDFYLITNVFPMGFTPDKIFSIVFMVKDNEIYPMYTNISTNTGFNGCKPYFSSFIDVNDDSKSEVILSCAKYSTSNVSRMLYEFKNNEFKILISNNK